MKAIALCHNVTPVYESHAIVNGETESAEADQDFSDENRTYQAASPDEVNMRYTLRFIYVCVSEVAPEDVFLILLSTHDQQVERCPKGLI